MIFIASLAAETVSIAVKADSISSAPPFILGHDCISLGRPATHVSSITWREYSHE